MRRIDLPGKKWRPMEPPGSGEPSWRISGTGKPYLAIRGHVLLVSTVEDDVGVFFKWGMKRPKTDHWEFSQVYYKTIEEAKAAALFQVGIGKPSIDQIDAQPSGRPGDAPRIARRIFLD